ncbi:MAG: PAS domain-containing protein [Bradyrhizobiaceae bacterium]|nr:PAS domain-containing protein [Bradyrhizobiaceae bacterium]
MRGYKRRPPDVVRSIRQRWLLAYWTRLRADRALPLWSELDTGQLDSCFDDLTIVDAVPNGGRPLFRIFNHGKNVGAMYAGQCAGKLLADTLPEATRARTLETYEQAAHTRLPVFTTSGILDAKERPVIYERLLLPFSQSGEEATRILGFLETISPEGIFERRELMTRAHAASDFAIKAVLQTRL